MHSTNPSVRPQRIPCCKNTHPRVAPIWCGSRAALCDLGGSGSPLGIRGSSTHSLRTLCPTLWLFPVVVSTGTSVLPASSASRSRQCGQAYQRTRLTSIAASTCSRLQCGPRTCKFRSTVQFHMCSVHLSCSSMMHGKPDPFTCIRLTAHPTCGTHQPINT